MTRAPDNPWLHRFAVLTAAATLFLIWVGGLVTSHGVGMAVPDWPTTYGDNMFFFPFSKWAGGIFYEHSHRLVASVVGLLTAVLAAWIWARESTGWPRRIALGGIVFTLGLMGVRTQGMFIALACVAVGVLAFGVVQLARDERKLRWLAAMAFCVVLIQGVLGGLRVTAMKDELGIVHGTLAQLFFALLCVIALVTSRWWWRMARAGANIDNGRAVVERQRTGAVQDAGAQTGSLSSRSILDCASPLALSASNAPERIEVSRGPQTDADNLAVYGAGRLRYFFALVTGLILAQLILGATMRHQHAGLAIPDFPTAYGKLWPATDAESVARYNQQRVEVTALNPITSAGVHLQMTHRLLALAIFVGVAWLAGAARSRFGAKSPMGRLAAVWFGVILLQVILGAATIWTGKAADIATAHVAVGALSLVTGVMLCLVSFRTASRVTSAKNQSVPAGSPANLEARPANASA